MVTVVFFIVIFFSFRFLRFFSFFFFFFYFFIKFYFVIPVSSNDSHDRQHMHACNVALYLNADVLVNSFVIGIRFSRITYHLPRIYILSYSFLFSLVLTLSLVTSTGICILFLHSRTTISQARYLLLGQS